MPYVEVKLVDGCSANFPILLSEVVRHCRTVGKREHPSRPRVPAELWIFDIAKRKTHTNFPNKKIKRITIKKGLL